MNNLVISDNTISGVWFKMMDIILSQSGKPLSPVLINLFDVDPNISEKKDPIRTALDLSLERREKNNTNTVANTIFPQSLYRLAGYDRHKLYDLYLNLVPKMKELDNRNKDGIYFERLIEFDATHKKNQLEFIIREFTNRRGVRKSMLQASIFDPNRDHKRQAQLGFPCLQHVSFTYFDGHMNVNAFYATQQLFDKAYGNLLGLLRLGNFMAKEMELELSQVNCYVGVEKLENVKKSDGDLQSIMKIAREYFK